MHKISAYVIAYNEAEKVAATLASLGWCDEVVLVDSFSTDGTAEIATSLGARVVQVDFQGFGDLRNEAVKACTHHWILSIDADERCTPEVQQEIQMIIKSDDALDAYLVPRRNYFMGRWIRHSGWYPNFRQPQLFRKDALTYDFKPVHEGYTLHTSKPVGVLKNAIWQFPFKNTAELLHKANRYSTLGAAKLTGKKVSLSKALAHGIWSFIKHYIFKLGVLDGWPGFIIAVGNFEGTFYRYVKAVEKQNEEKWKPPISFRAE